MLELREKNGPGAVAELVKSQIDSSTADVILIDGIRSNDEIKVLRKFGDVKLLAVHASTDVITSYSIHYPKLYEISSKNCLKCGSQNISHDDNKFSCKDCGLSFCCYTCTREIEVTNRK